MPRKKKSEIVEEKIEPMKDDAMNLPVEEKEEEKVEVKNDTPAVSSARRIEKKRINAPSNLVNVREAPDSEVMFRLQNGTPVLVEDYDEKWVKVSGFVMKSLIGEL